MQPPSSLQQLALVIAFVLPGVVYQYLREHWRGPVPGNAQTGERILRAMTASLLLDALYAAAVGPILVSLSRAGDSWFRGLAERPRAAGLWALTLFVLIPSATAAVITWWERRHAWTVFRRTPTAWDFVFGDRTAATPRFIRARLKDGRWVGGWYGPRSFAAGHSASPDLYLQWAYEMHPDGSFGPPVTATAGLYLRAHDTDLIEFVRSEETTACLTS